MMMIFARTRKNKQPVSEETPRPPRYSSVARILINGFDGEAVLRNISTGGFRMESRTYAALQAGKSYAIQIKPEAASTISPFNLEVEVRWVQSTETSFNSGFLIIKAPPDRSFEQYLDYIKRSGATA
jgi:hypothetical protein